MRKVFNDIKLQNQFDRDGYVKIPFLDDNSVKNLLTYYHLNNVTNQYYKEEYAEFTVLASELNVREKIFEKITSAFKKSSDKILTEYKPVIANFVRKPPGKGLVPIHQNWSVIDEYKYTSVSIWLPLQNVNKKNGTLGFVKGSHKVWRGARGGDVNQRFINIEDWVLENFIEFEDVCIGDAIILDDSVIHFSDINKSTEDRLAIQLIMAPKEAEIIYYDYKAINDVAHISEYLVDVDFFIKMDNWVGDLQNYKLKNSYTKQHLVLSKKQFKKSMNITTIFDRLNFFSK